MSDTPDFETGTEARMRFLTVNFGSYYVHPEIAEAYKKWNEEHGARSSIDDRGIVTVDDLESEPVKREVL